MEEVDEKEMRALRRQASRAVRANIGLRWHLAVYALVSVLLIVINLQTTPDMLWSVFPVGGWGVGVLLHAFAVRGQGDREAMIEAEVQRRLAARGKTV